MTEPAISPLLSSAMDDKQRELIRPMAEQGRDYNVFRAMAQRTEAFSAFLPWGGYILSEQNSLTPRQRELLILGTGAQHRCAYEFLRHAVIARQFGFTEAELERLVLLDATGWSEEETLLLGCIVQLCNDGAIAPSSFDVLIAQLGQNRAIDTIWTVGQYAQVCLFLKTLQVPLDADIAADSLIPVLRAAWPEAVPPG